MAIAYGKNTAGKVYVIIGFNEWTMTPIGFIVGQDTKLRSFSPEEMTGALYLTAEDALAS